MTLFIKQPIEGAPLPHGFARWCRAVDKALCGISVTNGRVSWSGGMPMITVDQVQAQTFPFGVGHPWGLVSVIGQVVTIAQGDLQVGTGPNSYITSAQLSFTITVDASWIGLRYNPAAQTLTLIGPGTSGYDPTTKPGGAHDGVVDTWLYLFKLISYTNTATPPVTTKTAVWQRHNLTGIHAAFYAYATS